MRSEERGFTLLELLVVVAVIGILAAIAVPFYRSYVKRGYEAVAIQYMRSWVPAQELYLQKFGHYADADEQLQNNLHVLFVPGDAPYVFSIDSNSSATTNWWGRGRPREPDLRYFYIDQSGKLLGSLTGPPSP
ncbi:MAG: type IV pilin protein [Candidatus Binatia bacterium]